MIWSGVRTERPHLAVGLALALAGCGGRATPPDVAWATLVDPHRHEVDVGGLTVHYVDVGHGEPVVLVHGFGDSTYGWRGNVAALRDAGWVKEHVQKIRATRSRLVQGLEGLRHRVLPSSANFVFTRLASSEQASAAYRFLKERGILVRYFARPLLDDGLRITVGTDDEISALLAALEDFSRTSAPG